MPKSKNPSGDVAEESPRIVDVPKTEHCADETLGINIKTQIGREIDLGRLCIPDSDNPRFHARATDMVGAGEERDGRACPESRVRRAVGKSVVATSILLVLFAGQSHAQSGSTGAASCTALNETHTITDLGVSQTETGSSIISWSFPSDVCIDGFRVAATPLDAYGKQDGETTYFTTELQSTAVPEVEYLRPYTFEVQVKLEDGRYGPKASTITTPYGSCTVEGTPGRIESLVVTEDDQGFNLHGGDTATVCWTPPVGGSCVDEYTLGRRMRARNDAEAFNDDFQWKFFTFERAGCHEVGGHVAGRVYDYGIRGTNTKNGTYGAVTAAEAFMRDSWVCVRGGNGYPRCSAGEQEQCAAMDCKEVSRLGLCGAPFVRSYDDKKKIVVQFCGEQCACNVPSAAEITQRSMLGRVPDGVLMDDAFACCSRP